MSNTAQSLAGKRIEALLDENSFVEIGSCVTARSTDFNLSEKETPSDGVITGYGVIDGSLVYVYSQDASVLNGTIGEMHAKKIVRLYEMAMKTGAPVIGLVDCAGFRLQEATDALNAFGEIYAKQVAASGVIPQITGIFGTCGGGLAIMPGLTDFTFMEEKNQSEESGLADVTGSEDEIIAKMRELVSLLPSNYEDNSAYVECTDDLNRVCPELVNCAGDTSIALSLLADNQEFFEVKADYAKDMVVGFIRLNGATVGCVANRSEVYNAEGEKAETFDNVLSVRGCKKAADFVKFCDAFELPVLTLTNVKGYKATKCSEANIAKAAASLTYAFANATVPKVNVVVGEAFGSAYLTMNSKSTGADMVFAWPESQIGMMDAKLAAKIMYADSDAATINEKAAEYAQLQSSALSAAKRGYVDTIIEPEDTRKYVIGAFEMLFTKRENRPSKKHGTV